MPDPNTPVAPIAQPAVAVESAPVLATPVVETPAAPLSEREKIYEKYYQTQEALPLQATSTPAPAATPAPQPTTLEQPVATPAPQATDPAIAALVAEVQALRAQVQAQAPPPVAAPAALSPAEQKDWLALMAEGKKEEGEKLFAQKIEREISERIQNQAMERMEANRTMYEFTTKIRNENPDLVQMEDYIAYAAKNKLDAAVQAGRIKTPADYATVYKESVTAEVEKARNLANALRGVGKNEALTRSREVVSTQTLQPNAINQNRETPVTPSEPAQETVEDYFTQRRQRSLAGRGLSVA